MVVDACGAQLRELHLTNSMHDSSGLPLLAPALRRLSGLEALHLQQNPLGAAGAEVLAPALQALSRLTELQLALCRLGDERAASLAPAIQALGSLRALGLGGNQVGEDGMAALGPALRAATALTRLGLQDNPLGSAGATALASAILQGPLSELKALELPRAALGPQGAAALALTGLTRLILRRLRDAGPAALAPCTGKLTAQQELNLSHNQLGKWGFYYLAPTVRSFPCLACLKLKEEGGEDDE